MTVVHNLRTGETKSYTLAAQDAVVAAWEQSCGNHNTWTYQDSKAPIVRGRHTIAADDWCVLLRSAGGY